MSDTAHWPPETGSYVFRPFNIIISATYEAAIGMHEVLCTHFNFPEMGMGEVGNGRTRRLSNVTEGGERNLDAAASSIVQAVAAATVKKSD